MELTIGIDGRYLGAHYPGVGRYAFELLRALPAVAAGAEIRAMVHPLTSDPARLNALSEAGVTLCAVDAAPRSLAAQWQLPRHSQGLTLFHAPFYLTAYRQPCPLVVSVHDVIAADRAFLPSRFGRLAFHLALRLALRAARLVLTLSEAARRDLVQRFRIAPERVVVTPAAAAPALCPASPEAIEALRARLGLTRPYVLHLGTDRPHKNLPRLVEAWSRLPPAVRQDHLLLLAGRRDRRFPQAAQQAARLGADVHFLGPVAEADLAPLLSAATLFVFPSLVEGFGLPVLEAMACGTAVACARATSLPEVAGEAAAYFDPRDVDAMASLLARLLADPAQRTELVENGLARAGTFSWSRTARLTVEAYQQVAPWPQPQ